MQFQSHPHRDKPAPPKLKSCGQPTENPAILYSISSSKIEGIKYWLSEFRKGKITEAQSLEFFRAEYDRGALNAEEFDAAETLTRRFFASIEAEKQQRELILELLKTQRAKNYKASWVYHQLLKKYPRPTLKTLQYLAEKLGYKRSWASYQNFKLSGCYD